MLDDLLQSSPRLCFLAVKLRTHDCDERTRGLVSVGLLTDCLSASRASSESSYRPRGSRPYNVFSYATLGVALGYSPGGLRNS